MENFGKWVLIYAWLCLCPYFERVVPTSGGNGGTVRWYFEWRDPVLVTVQHGDPMRLQGIPHIHCVVTENIGNKVALYKGTPPNCDLWVQRSVRLMNSKELTCSRQKVSCLTLRNQPRWHRTVSIPTNEDKNDHTFRTLKLRVSVDRNCY